jgi:hypothetical protein
MPLNEAKRTVGNADLLADLERDARGLRTLNAFLNLAQDALGLESGIGTGRLNRNQGSR